MAGENRKILCVLRCSVDFAAVFIVVHHARNQLACACATVFTGTDWRITHNTVRLYMYDWYSFGQLVASHIYMAAGIQCFCDDLC